MFDFHTVLEYDEEILYQSKTYPGKGNKNIACDILIIGFSAVFLTIILLALKFKLGDCADGITLSILIFLILLIGAILFGLWDILYRLFIKDYTTADDLCCVTNKRILKYEERPDKLTSVYINDLDTFIVTYTMHGYGDAAFYKGIDKNCKPIKELTKRAWNAAANDDHTAITFSNVKNPKKAVSIAKQVKNEP